MSGRLAGSHPKPYPDYKNPTCEAGKIARGIVLGTDFITDVLLLSFRVAPPVTLKPNLLSTQVLLRTVSEALVKAACREMDLELDELEAEFRPALTADGKTGHEAEIYLYDTLPGGAGFAQQAGKLGERLFVRALDLLNNCKGNCDSSCYRCLRVYTNKLDHRLLDRQLAAAFLGYIMSGSLPVLDTSRADRSTDLLFNDLGRQAAADIRFERRAIVTVPGFDDVCAPILATKMDGAQTIIDVTCPITPTHSVDDALRELAECSGAVNVLLVDELQIRKSLPWTTNTLLEKLGVKRGCGA